MPGHHAIVPTDFIRVADAHYIAGYHSQWSDGSRRDGGILTADAHRGLQTDALDEAVFPGIESIVDGIGIFLPNFVGAGIRIREEPDVVLGSRASGGELHPFHVLDQDLGGGFNPTEVDESHETGHGHGRENSDDRDHGQDFRHAETA